MDSLLLLAET